MTFLRPSRWIGLSLLALAALPSEGGAGFRRSLDPPPPELQARCQAVPACCREHFHIYMINGLTILPHVFGSMNGLAPYVEELGFCKPKVASHYWRWAFQNDIRRIHQADPAARFVLVGYSIGGSVVYSMAQTLAKDGIFIDLIIYIDAHSFVHNFNPRPANVGKIVGINSASWVLAGKCHDGEECHCVDTVFHLAAPRQETTLLVLARELTELAASCPIPPESMSPSLSEAPRSPP
jgi:hypothetical protein